MSDRVTFTVSKALAERVDALAARGDLKAKQGIEAMLEAYVEMMEWGHATAEAVFARSASEGKK